MRWSLVRLLTVAAAAIVTACDTSTSVDVPVIRPSFDQVAVDGTEYTLVEGDISQQKKEASAWIDRKGGWLVVYGERKDDQPTMHGIYVPEGAVNKPTLFSIRTLGGNKVGVRLDARVQNKNGSWQEVGSKGFRQEVTLFMSYAFATNVSDPSRLVILYDPEDGKSHQRTKSEVYVDTDKFVVAKLAHFSKYVMAVH